MEFQEAKKFRIPWGDLKGRTINEAAITNAGLRNLDRLLGWMETKNYKGPFREALETYMSDPGIRKELEDAS